MTDGSSCDYRGYKNNLYSVIGISSYALNNMVRSEINILLGGNLAEQRNAFT